MKYILYTQLFKFQLNIKNFQTSGYLKKILRRLYTFACENSKMAARTFPPSRIPVVCARRNGEIHDVDSLTLPRPLPWPHVGCATYHTLRGSGQRYAGK